MSEGPGNAAEDRQASGRTARPRFSYAELNMVGSRPPRAYILTSWPPSLMRLTSVSSRRCDACSSRSITLHNAQRTPLEKTSPLPYAEP